MRAVSTLAMPSRSKEPRDVTDSVVPSARARAGSAGLIPLALASISKEKRSRRRGACHGFMATRALSASREPWGSLTSAASSAPLTRGAVSGP